MLTPAPLNLTSSWDKTFALHPEISHRKVTFVNRYGITLAADLYVRQELDPATTAQPLPALVVCGPFGAVKEQCAGLYAQEMALRGFLTVAFDPSFIGESGGMPRNVASPDINTEDVSAAVDYLLTSGWVRDAQVGVIGICGWGGIGLNAAAQDPRIKATAAMTMYNMSRVTANGYYDSVDVHARYQTRVSLSQQRLDDYQAGDYARAGGVPDELPADAPQFLRDYFAYYKTSRGYHPRSLNSNAGWNVTSSSSFMNFPLLAYAHEIRSACLLVHGEQAHSRYFSEDTFAQLVGEQSVAPENKELLIIPGANHVDLYDNHEVIPWDKLEAFFSKYLGA